MNLILVALIIIAVAVYVAWPLRRGFVANANANANIEYSMSEEVAPINARDALEQLDFDLSMGKIDDIEYREARAQLTAEIVDEGVVPTPPSSDDADLEAEILIARARRKRETQVEIQNATWICGECAREMSGADRFCASCGAARVMETATSSS